MAVQPPGCSRAPGAEEARPACPGAEGPGQTGCGSLRTPCIRGPLFSGTFHAQEAQQKPLDFGLISRFQMVEAFIAIP